MDGRTEHVDVIVVGAGLSGIAAGHHLQTKCPSKTFAILEAREGIGGTWDLFRYPGIRSDSDMFTLGYSFRPWKSDKAIADGASILAYVRDTAREEGIDRKIRFRHRVLSASWSSDAARWTLEVKREDTGELLHMTASFVMMCTGYYDYERGYTPDLPGLDRNRGRVVHPQHWPEDLDYAGKRVVAIGSGATAVTLVPELAKKAALVTMLQRSPRYVVSIPEVDPLAAWLGDKLPDRMTRSDLTSAGRTSSWRQGVQQLPWSAKPSRTARPRCSSARSPNGSAPSTRRSTSHRATRRGISACASSRTPISSGRSSRKKRRS